MLAIVDPDADNNRILFGTLVAVQGNRLTVQIPSYEPTAREPRTYFRLVLPGLGDVTGQRLTVITGPNTVVQLQGGGLAAAVPGVHVMVAGVVAGGAFAAHYICDVSLIQAHLQTSSEWRRPAATGVWHQLPREQTPSFFVPPGFPGREEGVFEPRNIAGTDPNTIDFDGKMGGPAWRIGTGTLGVPLLPGVKLTSLELVAGLGGGAYKYPFSFAETRPQPLIVDSDGTVELTVTPKAPGNEQPSFYWALGVAAVIWIRIDIDIDLPDPLPDVGIHDDYSYALAEFSQVNESRDPALMPGESKDMDAVACPGIDFVNIPFVPVIGIQLCTVWSVTGAPFSADLGARDSLYGPLQPGWRYFNHQPGVHDFDGKSARTIQVRPATNPLAIDLRDFVYRPQAKAGVSAGFYVADQTLFETPPVYYTEGAMYFIPPYTKDCEFFNTNTCGEQPSKWTLTVPVIPVVTGVVASPGLVRQGETVTLQALVRGANGPGNSAKQVTFYDGPNPLGTAAIDAADVATLRTASLDACKHVISAEFIGSDAAGVTYPSRKQTVLIVVGDAQWAGSEGYWQHQTAGNGRVNYDGAAIGCYLATVGHLSTVFSEARDASTRPAAYEVLFLGNNGGSLKQQLDRELLVAWLNVASGATGYNQPVDVDGNGASDLTLAAVLAAAETARLDPGATESDLRNHIGILHRARAQATYME